jgi:hypothetical protein
MLFLRLSNPFDGMDEGKRRSADFPLLASTLQPILSIEICGETTSQL